MRRLWRYLFHGADELVLPQSWLENTHARALDEAYTKRQLWQGSVVSDAAAMQRRAFWAEREARRAFTWALPANVRRFGKG